MAKETSMHDDQDGWSHLRDIEASDSTHLKGKTVVLAISASVAALESHRLARALMRHGARVQVFLTPSARALVSETSLEWATGAAVITELSGRCEHLEFFGHRGRADLLLLAPATANTIGKVALGLDDNAVTTTVTTALGSGIPVLCCPGMHEPMLANPAVARNLGRLKELGIELMAPTISEGKAKMMAVPEIVARVLRRLSDQSLSDRTVLLTGGPTREYLDPARCLTNPSSGLSACHLAEEAYRRGAKVTLVYGPGQAVPGAWLEVIRVETAEQMGEAVLAQLQQSPVNMALAVAAVADFRPASRLTDKLPTADHEELNLKLVRTAKIIEQIRATSPGTTLIAFKASSRTDDEGLAEQANAYLSSGRADWVVANSVVLPGMGFESERNRYLLCSASRPPRALGPAGKRELAVLLWDALTSSN
jgi:phosphopantothenoylcysteine decarboxylase/phosphopantothenate--cysteine ligase